MSSGLVSTDSLRTSETCAHEHRWTISFVLVHALCVAVPSGLGKIYELTNTPTQYELRFDLGVGAERTYAAYDNFKIAPVKQKFQITIGKYSGTAGEPLTESSNTTDSMLYKHILSDTWLIKKSCREEKRARMAMRPTSGNTGLSSSSHPTHQCIGGVETCIQPVMGWSSNGFSEL